MEVNDGCLVSGKQWQSALPVPDRRTRYRQDAPLAESLVAWVAHQGFSTATAHCYAAEGWLTYTPVIAWLRSPAIHKALGALDVLWRSELARLLPELLIEQPDLPQPAPITQGWQRQRFFEALARAVLTQNKPLIMFVDDLPMGRP